MMRCYLLSLVFLCAAHAQLIRNYFEKRALFYKPMENNKVLNITPIYSYTSISTMSSCVRSCLHMAPCFAVNYGSKNRICELLDQDRSTKLSSDFVERIDYVYMDTLTHFDGCYIGESCYPCYCQANSYTREPCDCTSSADVPTPDVHIPLKKLEKDTGTSPYGRGDDNHNGTDVTIVPSTGRISKDQFGKGSALHSINNYLNPQPLEYGNFTGTAISPGADTEKVGSLSFWFRTTVNAYQTDTRCMLMVANNQGVAIGLTNNANPALLNFQVWFWPFSTQELGIWHITTTYDELKYWTHLTMTFKYEDYRPHPSCTIPFNYYGTWYDDCTYVNDHIVPWCAYHQHYILNNWNYCIRDIGVNFYINGVFKANEATLYTSASLRFYINGVLKGSSTTSNSITPASGPTLPLQSTCHGTYMNDLSIWYSRLTDANVLALYNNDVSNPKWDLSKNIVTAGSCKALQDENPSLQTNGYYWILLDGHMITVWCDMEVDGGGWTRISYTDGSIIGLATIRIDDHSFIGETHKRNVFLTNSAIQTLQTLMGFRQLRVFCQSPEFHNRTMDIATTKPDIVDFWLGSTNTSPSNYCSVFYRLEGDTSRMFSATCSHNDVTLPRLNKFTHPESALRFRMGFQDDKWNCDALYNQLGGVYMIFVR